MHALPSRLRCKSGTAGLSRPGPATTFTWTCGPQLCQRGILCICIRPEHLLLGLLHAYPKTVQTALGVWPEEVRDAIMRFASAGPQDTSESLPFTRMSLEALKAAQRTARELHSDRVGIKHLLIGVLSVHSDRLDRALVDAGVDRDSAQMRVMAALTRG